MNSMLHKIYDEALVRSNQPETIVGDSQIFYTLPLHTITVEELSFLKEFSITLNQDIDALDGWAIWFDIFFMPSRESVLPEDAIPSEMQKKGVVSFTTGPHGTETHWQQTILLIDQAKRNAQPLKKGQTISGKVGYEKTEKGARGVDISVQWDSDASEKGVQLWSLL
jgi:protein arginine N-methyltransferase 3